MLFPVITPTVKIVILFPIFKGAAINYHRWGATNKWEGVIDSTSALIGGSQFPHPFIDSKPLWQGDHRFHSPSDRGFHITGYKIKNACKLCVPYFLPYNAFMICIIGKSDLHNFLLVKQKGKNSKFYVTFSFIFYTETQSFHYKNLKYGQDIRKWLYTLILGKCIL